MSQSPLNATAHYTDDVKEMAYLTPYLAQKRLKAHPKTKVATFKEPAISLDVLTALCSVARRFSYTDSLLRDLNTSAKEVEKLIEHTLQHQSLSGNPLPASQIFNDAEQLKGDNDKVSAAQILLALSQAEDPWLALVLEKMHVTPAAIEQAIIKQEQPALLGLTRHALNSLLFVLRETAEMVFVVIFCLIVIKQGIGELRLIPSESMVPTLQIGDRVVVEKVTRWFRPLQRNDVVVFYPPPPDSLLKKDPISLFMRATGFSSLFHNKAEDPVDKAYIKRLIALPGDEVVVVNHLGVYVNGVLQNEPFVNEVAINCGAFCSPTTIPKGYYFMMGDNRNHSKDSRYFGLQPANRVVGRAIYRIFPLSRMGTLDE